MDKTKPHLDEDGTLVIPFECADHGYKYWKQEGRSLAEILAEMGVGEATWAAYTHVPYPEPGEAGPLPASHAEAGRVVKGNAFDEEPDDQDTPLDTETDPEPPTPSEADLAHSTLMA